MTSIFDWFIRPKRFIYVAALVFSFAQVSQADLGLEEKIRTLSCTIDLLPAPSQSAREAIAYWSKLLSEKYPEFKEILLNPQEFVQKYRTRFAEQKLKNPLQPFNFSFKELGMPSIQFMAESLDKRIVEMTETIAQRQVYSSRVASVLNLRRKEIEELKVGLEYYQALKAEVQQIQNEGDVGYQTLHELSYFYARAIGHFEERRLRLDRRFFLQIDKAIDGYYQLSIQKEFDLYKRRDFELFMYDSFDKGYSATAQPFSRAFNDQSKLHFIMIPTAISLDLDIFMRLMGQDIYFAGLSDTPFLSEGFMRPGGKFLVHDYRHNSAIYYQFAKYIEQYGITDQQANILKVNSDLWMKQLEDELAKVNDPDLVGGIRFMMFNFSHDRGKPVFPSLYANAKLSPIPFLLLTIMKISGQKTVVDRYSNVYKSFYWLREFWEKRVPEEMAINKRLMLRRR